MLGTRYWKGRSIGPFCTIGKSDFSKKELTRVINISCKISFAQSSLNQCTRITWFDTPTLHTRPRALNSVEPTKLCWEHLYLMLGHVYQYSLQSIKKLWTVEVVCFTIFVATAHPLYHVVTPICSLPVICNGINSIQLKYDEMCRWAHTLLLLAKIDLFLLPSSIITQKSSFLHLSLAIFILRNTTIQVASRK